MKKVRKLWAILGYNVKVLVEFEYLFKLLTLFVFAPLFLKLFNWIMLVTGYSYLAFENVFSFLCHPTTLK